MFPTVTIIICARNAADHLPRCLGAVRRLHYPAGRLKVLVVDNGSTDGTADIARRHGAIVRHLAKPGIARARDFGWRRARSEVIAFLDADCEPPENWIEGGVRRLYEADRIAAVGVRLVSGPITNVYERHIVESRILDSDRCWERNALSFPYVVTAGMLVRRAALEAVDGFDLTLGRQAGEDADLCWRLRRAGWDIRYERAIEVVHHHRSTLWGMLRQVHWYGRGSAALFARWRGDLGWWRYTDWAVYRRLAGGVLGILPALVLGSDGDHRAKPLLQALDATAFLSGKWIGAIKNRVWFI